MNAHAAFPRKPAYPGKVAIRHAVEAARACGIDVGGVEVAPDGTIRVLRADAMPTKEQSLFDQLDRAGQL